MTDTTTLLLDPLDELLVARHGHLVSEVLDLRTELMRIEQLLKSRKVQFESYFPSARTAPAARLDDSPVPGLRAAVATALEDNAADDALAKFAASPEGSAGSQPAGGVSGVIPPANPAPPARKQRKYDRNALIATATRAHDEERSLTAALAAEHGMSKMTAQAYVSDMRKRGEIPPARRRPSTPLSQPQPAAPVSVIDDDTMALRCDDCSFAAPVGPLQPLRVHVLDVHKRVLSNTERKPRLVVE
jgi:hypothetical protein